MEKPKLTPKDFFLYAGAMITLYWSSGALVALLFRIIDTVLRDDLNYHFDPYSSGIRFAIASLIVVFPISLFLFRAIKKDAMAHSEKFLLPLRRWLYALTIFVTAVALIGDLIALLNSFLGGELTARFVLKALSVFVIAGAIFGYSLLEIKLRPDSPSPTRKEFLWGAPILVLLAIVYGFVVMGSPGAIRALRFDERRVSDLQSIQWQIVNFWQQKGRLPAVQTDLEDPISGFRAPVDPSAKTAYEYAKKSERVFELCAAFERPSASERMPKPYYMGERLNENWEHQAGRHCFERTIDPELYPVKPVRAM